jgi:dolichol-phosphate mannosyltransferase
MPEYSSAVARPAQQSERVSVVIPALDEAGNIGRLIEETFAAVPAGVLEEVIVVDDASRDTTVAEVTRLMPQHPRLRLIRHLIRSGQSSATRTGIRFAKGDFIATMDGDGQNDPADIPRLYALLMAEGPGTALAGGVRTSRKADGSKRIASRLANWLRDRVLDDGCPDTGCGIKVFARQIYMDLPFFCGLHRYLPALFQTYGHRTVFLSVNDRSRKAGRSKYTNLGRALLGIRDLAGVSWIHARTRLTPVAEIRRPESGRAIHRHEIDRSAAVEAVRNRPLSPPSHTIYAGARP